LHRSPIVVGFSAKGPFVCWPAPPQLGVVLWGTLRLRQCVVSVECADEKPFELCSSIVSVSIAGATRAWSPVHVTWIHGFMDDCPCMAYAMHACQYRGSESRLCLCACIHTWECLNWQECVWAERSVVLKGKSSYGHGPWSLARTGMVHGVWPNWSQIPASWSIVCC
jgi:hypothetical protein